MTFKVGPFEIVWLLVLFVAKVIYPKYVLQTGSLRQYILKISAFLPKYPNFEGVFFIFSWAKHYSLYFCSKVYFLVENRH